MEVVAEDVAEIAIILVAGIVKELVQAVVFKSVLIIARGIAKTPVAIVATTDVQPLHGPNSSLQLQLEKQSQRNTQRKHIIYGK